jgi:hypothetical protein
MISYRNDERYVILWLNYVSWNVEIILEIYLAIFIVISGDSIGDSIATL